MQNPLQPLRQKSSRSRFQVWFKQARFDLQAAHMSFDHGYYEWAVYQAEQSVEKAIKAVLVHAGWKPPRVHKLQVLMGLANEANDEFKNTKFSFRHLESFTFISRYPFLLPNRNETPHEIIKKADAKKALGQAQEFVDKIATILKHEVVLPQKPLHPMSEMYLKDRVSERIDKVKEELVREFNPEAVILFGSFAKSLEPVEPSTIDILVVADCEESFVDRIVRARKATKGGLPVVEPLVYTKEEFETMLSGAEDSFMESALQEGKVLYEKTPGTITI